MMKDELKMLINRWGVRSTPVEIDGDKAGSGRYVWTPDRLPGDWQLNRFKKHCQ